MRLESTGLQPATQPRTLLSTGGGMESTVAELDSVGRTVREILQQDFHWADLAFVDGMAPITVRHGQQAWRPKVKLLRRLFGASNGPTVPLSRVLGSSCYLKFCLPDLETQKTMDYQHWRGYLDREVRYSTDADGHLLDRWVRFVGFATNGFDIDVEYVGSSGYARVPTIVMFGASWIQVAFPRDEG